MFGRIQLLVVLALAYGGAASVRKPVKKHQGVSLTGQAPAQAKADQEDAPAHHRGAHAAAHAGVSENASTPTDGPAHHKGAHAAQAEPQDLEKAVPASSEQPPLSSADDAADAVHSHHKHHQGHGGSDASKLLMAYGLAMVAMIACVSVMFYSLGATVVFQVVLYVGCLAFVKIALKLVYEQDFNYPKFITAVHLLISSSAAFVVLLNRWATTGKAVSVPTKDELFFGILPIASTFGFSIASENSALVFVSAAFSEVVASTNPVMSFTLTWVLGMGANLKLLAPIGVVVMGCLISVEGEMYFSAVGLVLLLLSVFFRGLKAVMQQKLMTGETKEKFDPVTLMAWTCMFAFGVVFTYSLASEGLAPFNAIANSPDVSSLMAALLGSAAIACTLNISALFVIKQLGAVGMQMVSQMKALLVVIGGMALLGESFTNMQKLGFGIVLSGVYWYSRVQRQAAAAANASAKGN